MPYKTTQTTIISIPDPDLIERYLTSCSGEKALLNIIRDNREKMKAILLGEEEDSNGLQNGKS